MKRESINGLAVLLVLAMVFGQNKAYATESVMAPTESVMVPTESNEIVSVELPVVEERDPFSFFIDPLHIFYNTFGNSGGNITVEEDTHLLFYNRDESEYTLSSRSDSLKIINKSTVPVEVTITAKLENADGIFVMQNKEFQDRDSCDLYLAIVDSQGNEQPLSENGEASVTVKLDKAPLDTYAYMFCEDIGEYRYVHQSADVVFDTYSFGLKGDCNEKGDWMSISGKTHVTISWKVEPVSGNPETGDDPDEELRDYWENTVSGNDVFADKEVSEDDDSSGKYTMTMAVKGEQGSDAMRTWLWQEVLNAKGH